MRVVPMVEYHRSSNSVISHVQSSKVLTLRDYRRFALSGCRMKEKRLTFPSRAGLGSARPGSLRDLAPEITRIGSSETTLPRTESESRYLIGFSALSTGETASAVYYSVTLLLCRSEDLKV